MPLEPVFETITLNERRGEINEKKKVEVKTEIVTESVNKILNVSAISFVNKPQEEQNKIKYDGKVVFYIAYETTDGEIKKCECGSEFSGLTESEIKNENCKISASCEVIKTETDANGLKLIVSALVGLKFNLFGCNTLSALCGGENLICDVKERTFCRGYGIRESVVPVEEEFELPLCVGEVLYHRATPVITATQCGVGAIIVDGEVRLSAILLQKGEKWDIIRNEKTMPFRIEIECEDAMPSLMAKAQVKVKSFKTDITVDEEKQISSVLASAVLQFEGEAFNEEKVNVAQDVFSKTEQVSVVTETANATYPLEDRLCESRITGTANTDEIPENAILKAVGGERVEIVSTQKEEGGVTIAGVLYCTGYFANDEGKFFTRKFETPFEKKIDCALTGEENVLVFANAENADGKIISPSEVELSALLIVSVRPEKNSEINYVKEVVSNGEKKPNENAISVFIPFEGEELWSLAKRLNESPEKLVQTNKDLTFPLSGKERIVIYRQK